MDFAYHSVLKETEIEHSFSNTGSISILRRKQKVKTEKKIQSVEG